MAPKGDCARSFRHCKRNRPTEQNAKRMTLISQHTASVSSSPCARFNSVHKLQQNTLKGRNEAPPLEEW
jgi:hypothetical protein